ncbi:hypothetical protein CBS147333_6104 [Penicillium roqueforti]|uniref:uncharacterized protein n=1 Tax=Penicillium roqueforti TaxID=5082 RepID=UPI001909D3CC|nr:uncharacterized protein LCP9604111_8131 [Penicillium roqueforti]KAF9242223.1 hypothetical protein LCP9604111_8131 [Penicillium roqueforti]KAI1833389.1 hypothetical protein CBS147337_5887 [Penicillium roqueforti]KAI3108518.1 hypothetical protein CBS147333_6104 [Penicillium roqueforti]KAI3132408.1 hypothetical protein CBS147326_5299 [Penicillium roqueforti]KAI3232209.1 hypothetical protein CBS147310_5635 [Penicillium roqueforti]
MPFQTREGTLQSDSVGKAKRKPVRRDPEKRRQQNAQAQRKYREKFRERLESLEALAASATPGRATERTPAAGTGPSEAVATISSTTAPTHIAKSLPAYDTWDISTSSPSTATSRECQYFTPQSNDTLSAPSVWDFTTYCPQADTSPSSLSIWDSPTHVSQSDGTPPSLSVWDSTTHVDPSLLICDKQNDALGLYWTTNIDCGCSSPHFQIRTEGPAGPFSCGEVRILRFGSSAPAADPYANNLRIETVCTIAALSTLGIHVGITEETLCAEESLSPFFQSSTESADDMAKANMICTVKRTFKTLKPDLRPSSEQITVKHHPYIDILPFPTLRKGLIAHQEEVDEDNFFHDMLNGLVCWGGAGIGKKDRNNSTGYVSTGTPWDVRSWEARVWFLKKYWTLLGGEDGELVRQSFRLAARDISIPDRAYRLLRHDQGHQLIDSGYIK